MYKSHKHKIKYRIVSIRQPWIRQIVRGKAKDKVEFGAKIDLSVYKGFARLEHTSFEAYNESENLISEVERFYEREKHYPKRVLADQIYRNR
jgi:DNA-directed RNA polymerase subunit E'/Rpb7